MEISSLKTFLAVVKYGSFKKASNKFFLTPRAVSKQMDQLENELGVPLFLRNKNNSKLTAEGRQFVIAAEDIVNLYTNELNSIQNLKNKDNHLVRIGFSSANQEVELQHVWNEIALKNKYNFQFIQESSERLLKLILSNKLDVAITPSYYLTDDMSDDIEVIKLLNGKLLVGISKLNTLAQKDELTVQEIKGYQVYYYSPYDSDFMRGVLLQKVPNVFNENNIKRCSSLELRDAYVASNNGIGFYPSPFLDLEKTRSPMINFLPLRDAKNMLYSSCLIYNKKKQSSAVNTFIERLNMYF